MKNLLRKSGPLLAIFALVQMAFGVLSWKLVRSGVDYVVIFHFVSAAVCLFLSVFSGAFSAPELRQKSGNFFWHISSVVYSLLFVVVVVLGNIFVLQHEVLRYDATEAKVFSLAEQTDKLVSGLKYPLTVRAFAINGTLPVRTAEILTLLAARSSQFTWELYDVEKELLLVEKYGITEGNTLHFAYADPAGERGVKVSGVMAEQHIASAILKLVSSAPRVLYYISGYGEGNLESGAEGGYAFLREGIEGENVVVRRLVLSNTQDIPQDASAIMLLGLEKRLLPEARRKIERYLDNGGSAVFMLEPRSETDTPELLKKFGINFIPSVVVDMLNDAQAGVALGVQPVVSRYGPHIITSGFTGTTVYSTVAAIVPEKTDPSQASERHVAPLAFSGEQSWGETDLAGLFSAEPQAAEGDGDIKGPVPIAAAYDALLKRGESEVSQRMVVFGDTDFVSNVNINLLFNKDFALNAINWVLGDVEKVTLRARTFRPSEVALGGAEIRQMFFLTSIVLPELLLLLGLSVWWLRKRR